MQTARGGYLRSWFSLGRTVNIRNVGVRIKQRENTNCDLRKYATSQLVIVRTMTLKLKCICDHCILILLVTCTVTADMNKPYSLDSETNVKKKKARLGSLNKRCSSDAVQLVQKPKLPQLYGHLIDLGVD